MKQRELKFRIWNTRKKDFVDSVRNVINLNGALMQKLNGEFAFYNPDEMIVMQFTGLKDKNGKEIYEGDIVLMKKGFDGIVKYHFQRAGFLIEYQQQPLRAIYVAEFNVTYGDGETYMDETLEIIGNIYEGRAVKAVAP